MGVYVGRYVRAADPNPSLRPVALRLRQPPAPQPGWSPGECWCGCGHVVENLRGDARFVTGHSQNVVVGIIEQQFGSIKDFVEFCDYQPGGKNFGRAAYRGHRARVHRRRGLDGQEVDQ